MRLTAISSHRALSASQEVANNQLRAKASWDGIFSYIIYLGETEPRLATERTGFVDTQDFPPLSLLALAASLSCDYAILLNSDIVLTQPIVWAIEKARRQNALAFMSRRFQFEPNAPFRPRDCEMVDGGLDFFGATPAMWKRFYRAVPEQLRIGHARWDNWANAFFSITAREHFFDLTSFKGVFHPRHESRYRPCAINWESDQYMERTAPNPVLLR